ncbi:CUB domain-containing protein 2 [Orchesella cincta]|uniref:CUB domain-containing protein 2 n=1 Tax=Orchesella cincta TaxID=48709 RepID=A0A1D2N1K3_ORCCI|nr:CUB domain-containing protein 2 [Orchesella cincta]
MKMKLNSILISFATVTLALGAQNVPISINDAGQDQETRCGATIEADFGTLTVPSSGQAISPGSICIFMIHLQTTNIFRLNFSSLDVSSSSSSDEDCTEAAVRIYSLTNLIPPDKGESYTFCNDNPPPPSSGNFFLSGNLATVIYQNGGGNSSGFTLNFEGLAFQPIPIAHESTYSSATSGFIRYPPVGEYEPNKVTTWLVKTSSDTSNIQLDVAVQRMDIEECGSQLGQANECLCDTLILYDVTSTGVLKETTRLCGKSEEQLIFEGLGPNFILAFFTDHINLPMVGTGFDILYQPSAPVSEITESPTDTTELPPPVANYSNECGGILTGDQGLIEYKIGTDYNNYERCLWTVRTYYRAQIRFTLEESGIEPRFDNVQIYTINSDGVQDKHTFNSSEDLPKTIVLNGTVALVLFQSDYSTIGQGFSLRFIAEEVWDVNVWNFEDHHRVVDLANEEIIRFPETGYYKNLELSTLTFIRPKFNPLHMIEMSITSLELEVDTENGKCLDKLHIYEIRQPTTALPHEEHLFRHTDTDGICELAFVNSSSPPVLATGFVFILATNRHGTFDGFELKMKSPVSPII